MGIRGNSGDLKQNYVYKCLSMGTTEKNPRETLVNV
jgi:hypothetical protein